MKIYFGFTVAGDRSSIDVARKIVAMLQEKGHEVLTEHLIHDNAWSQDRLIPAQQVYQRDMKWLEQWDLFLAEVPVRRSDWASRPAICSVEVQRE